MFKIKKNGIVYVFGRVASLLASAIGFTPPTGMSATNVQDAIVEVNGKVDSLLITDSFSINVTFNNSNYVDNNYPIPQKVGYRPLSASGYYTASAGYNVNGINVNNDSTLHLLLVHTNGTPVTETRNIAIYMTYIKS